MAGFDIRVQQRGGSAGSGHRVVISVDGGGQTRPVYTDSRGKAVVVTSSGLSGRVFVDGRDYGRVTAGLNLVTLR